jgi:hypothetical protein
MRRKNVEKVIDFAKELRADFPKRMSIPETAEYQEAVIQKAMKELFVSRRTAFEYVKTALSILKVPK